ncbi:hypothetical protein EUX98_g2745 [Antrodiella citrinella]|uniref:Protein phosphatase 1 regulatory subunit 7 n=1 Tax=Antrodiella citrinella TaxID=2447956 RepID=A0A4S4MY92_9APHY|nr:hypothetical protein EUX98_g2745 [Antrodiella citrinella]
MAEVTAAANITDETKAVVVPEVKKSARVAVVQQADNDTSDEEAAVEEEADVEDEEILADLSDDQEEINLIHSRLKSTAKLGLQRFTQLKKLCLRQNHIPSLDPEAFRPLTELEELDFYDNGLKTIGDALDECTKLEVLDLSFNLFRHVPDNLSKFPALHTIYFVQNKISQISGLKPIGRTLRSVELGGNRLRKIEGLESLVTLEQLWLGKNKITKLEGLENLKNLKILSIQSNRITKIEGLEGLENLEQLYLSHNGIKKIEGLETNTKLSTLDIAANFVSELENVSHLTGLEELWMNNNKIETLAGLEPQLQHITTLETIYLEHNPVQAKEGANYRRKVTLALPQISQLDATYVKQV